MLDKLLEISKGKQSCTNQKNLKVPRAASKSLNYVSKKREAERIDRENQKILNRIINVRPNKDVDNSRLNKDYYKNHVKNKKILMDKNQGVYVEDIIEMKRRFRDNSEGKRHTLLPKITPSGTATSGAQGARPKYNLMSHQQNRKMPTAG